jgi:hypothetical protein
VMHRCDQTSSLVQYDSRLLCTIEDEGHKLLRKKALLKLITV